MNPQQGEGACGSGLERRLEILGNQMAQDLISLGFLSRAARPSSK